MLVAYHIYIMESSLNMFRHELEYCGSFPKILDNSLF
jgi:hypothetical protein